MKDLRVFLSIELDSDTKNLVKQFIDELRANENFKNTKWTKPENLHITLTFLGKTPVNKISMLENELEKVTALYSPFKIKLSNLGAFPNFKKPRVIWIGIEKNQNLFKLKEDIDNRLQNLGFNFDKKPFLPHLTIGRQKYGIKTINIKEEFNFETSFLVDKINLVKSNLTRFRPIYTTIFSKYLRNDI